MEYSIKELSALAGISGRTLRYYDEIGLLKPSRVNDAGYRFYSEDEIEILQQIMFYRERGFELKIIKNIISDNDFDIVSALEDHLKDLNEQKKRTEALIDTVQKTLKSVKGELIMKDKDKFQAFKEKAVKKNEEMYGAEARKKYGDAEVDASNQKFMNMSQDEAGEFQNLEAEILTKLEAAVNAGATPESADAKTIVELHKRWISMTWKRYDVQAHKGVAMMYVADERFTAYYDRNVTGCARLLTDAVQYWADKI